MELDVSQLFDKLIILVWVQSLLVYAVTSDDVYFDSFGHCQRTQPFDLTNDEYILRHVGGEFVHETLICDITFKSPATHGVCLVFEEFQIQDCSMRIQIYAASSSTGSPWRILGCTDSKPGHLCTTNRYITVRVIKDALNYNKGYAFEIHARKSNNITERGVLFVSIGVFVVVIFGAVLLTAILAIFIIYCCCCKRRTGSPTKSEETVNKMTLENLHQVQPSAPPGDTEDQPWASNSGCHPYSQTCYSSYPVQYPPPLYMSPPPYQLDGFTKALEPISEPEQTSDSK
uniref:CUB domain-containing protein n=1 Tax=Arion vulgaris TaxID=1028688 RepID=A0A0B6XZA4_9EUPU